MQGATAKAKGQIDAAELSLQNLLYEKAHYLKEIRACQSFRCAACTHHKEDPELMRHTCIKPSWSLRRLSEDILL